jgi:hypothetical protein
MSASAVGPPLKIPKTERAQLYQSPSSIISFANGFAQRDVRLIEVCPNNKICQTIVIFHSILQHQVPRELLATVRNGEALSIIGDQTSEAVLCSKSLTFSIKKVETSNSGTYSGLCLIHCFIFY